MPASYRGILAVYVVLGVPLSAASVLVTAAIAVAYVFDGAQASLSALDLVTWAAFFLGPLAIVSLAWRARSQPTSVFGTVSRLVPALVVLGIILGTGCVFYMAWMWRQTIDQQAHHYCLFAGDACRERVEECLRARSAFEDYDEPERVAVLRACAKDP